MNFDTKYLIRWGIPGWVFMIFVCLMYVVREFKALSEADLNIGNVVSFVVLIGFVGVTIGYLMHQVYFSINWNGTNNKQRRVIDDALLLVKDKERIRKYKNHTWGKNYHEDYYLFEFHWHSFLLSLCIEKRTYLEDRYRHLLSTIHALGALRAALLSSLIVNFVIVLLTFSKTEPALSFVLPGLIILLNVYLLIVSDKGFKYYSSNLNHFQGYFLDNHFSEAEVSTNAEMELPEIDQQENEESIEV
ncbi:hypothetical protein KQI46_00895 [Lysinibacillus capsici]|uniref:hypothetical protein n=1 Tax=Lysinibacillus capsici TaxID=2115968 RepID=UPI001C10E617|nr:hypothetical protein [Lysinibacillus capsici]MBU5250516.1 hypothetical protein [Lysinibacillus capsici]